MVPPLHPSTVVHSPAGRIENGQRIYEYVSEDGTLFWSYVRLETGMSAPTKLIARDRVGVALEPFVRKLRALSVLLNRN